MVFLQGCPLRCPWCANPESQFMQKQLMYSRSRCVRCGNCEGLCGKGAITRAEDGSPIFDRTRCNVCGACAEECLQNAIRFAGEERGVAEIIREVLRDRVYYEQSGGGLTVSGGEPFAQFDGLLSLIQTAKRNGLHTAVETCGQAPHEQFRETIYWIDEVLFDLKHVDAKQLQPVCDADFTVIRKNLEWLARTYPESLTLRVPLIPGFNCDEITLCAMLEYVAGLGVKNIDILPYHNLGVDKYRQLDLPYTYQENHGDMRKMAEAVCEEYIRRGLQIHIS